jgi:hypothetical protein
MTISRSGDPTVRILTNDKGHYSNIRIKLHAASRSDAERAAYDLVMPIVSEIAYRADAPVEVKATYCVELATGTQMMAATLVGAIKKAPRVGNDTLDPAVRELLAVYREGLNSTNPLAQALCFFKVTEGAEIHHKQKMRGLGLPVDPQPIDSEHIPTSVAAFTDTTPWGRESFVPYLGKTFREVRESMREKIRVAIAHLIPGNDPLVSDSFDDLEICREVAPVLRFMARHLIAVEVDES